MDSPAFIRRGANFLNLHNDIAAQLRTTLERGEQTSHLIAVPDDGRSPAATDRLVLNYVAAGL
ncbi:MAG TPA: hypothetical protein VME46_20850 [Acidimicrobiales bacterium]|nr:hypothetical protein [Acidimicrobiales bacterium]